MIALKPCHRPYCISSSWLIFIGIFILVLIVRRWMINEETESTIRYIPFTNRPNVVTQHNITVVTGYFPFRKAKHSSSEYIDWLTHLLSFCQSPMIIFTNRDFYPTIYRLRHNATLPTFFILDYESPSEMPPIRSLIPTFKAQHRDDPEKYYHSIDLYAVWAAKSFMLNRSTQLNPFRSQWFFYLDAGAFRSTNYRFRQWPDLSLLESFLKSDRYLLGMIDRLPQTWCPLRYQVSEGPIRLDLIEGTFMAGSIDAIRWWTSIYYTTVNNYQQKNFFIGKDQSIMNAIALAYPNRLNMFLPFRLPCGNVWFAFGPVFSRIEERQTLSSWKTCFVQHIKNYIIPFEHVCRDPENLR